MQTPFDSEAIEAAFMASENCERPEVQAILTAAWADLIARRGKIIDTVVLSYTTFKEPAEEDSWIITGPVAIVRLK